MSTTVYTYQFPGPDLYLSAVLDTGTDLWPSDTLLPGDWVEIGTPPSYDSAVYPGLTRPFAVFDDPRDTPRVTTPIYELLVANTRTGKIGFELPYAKFSWDCPLNEAGSATFTVPIEAGSRFGRLDERNPRTMLREIATGPWRFSFALAYGGRVVWAGPLVAVSLDDAGQTVDFGCIELEGLLSRRLLVQPANAGVTTASADTTYQGTTLENIMVSLFGLSMNQAGAELPIDLPTVDTVGGHQRFYYGYDMATIADRVSALTKVIDGPDYRLDPYLTTAPDGNYLRWGLAVGNPYLNVASPWTFETGVNASLNYDLDSKDMAFDYYVPGSGQDRDKKVGYSADRTLVDAGFPLLQAADSSHSSAIEQPTLDGWAQGNVAAYAKPVETWSLVTQANGDPRLGEYRVGDEMSVGVYDHLLIDDGVFSRRITKLSGDESGKVTMSGDSKPEQYTQESDDTLLGSTESTEQTITVKQGTVPDAVWSTLLAWGYVGVPTDGMEALYITRSTLAAAYAYQDEAAVGV